MQSKFVLFITLALSAPSVVVAQDGVRELEERLNRAYPDDKRMKLTRESHFFDSPTGTLIYATRAYGGRFLVQMARDGEKEIGFTYIPKLNAWINHSTRRELLFMWLDATYCNAAMRIFPYVESWHIHTIVSVEDACATDQDQLRWTMPSHMDLHQLYELQCTNPEAHVCGVIASPLGIMTYCLNVDAIDGMSNYKIRRMLESEAEEMERSASKLKAHELRSFADMHDGLVILSFELVP